MSNLTSADIQAIIAAAVNSGVLAPASNLASGWILSTAALVFFMQAGFAMLEAGSCRSKNLTNILLKNLLDTCVGCIFWFFWGFAFAFGDDPNNPIIGNRYFALTHVPSGTVSYPFFFFQWTFSATSATIVSGAMAERTRFGAYLIITLVISSWIYPIIAHWVWSHNGWLTIQRLPKDVGSLLFKSGMIDFSGSGVVHMVGGTTGLIGTFLLGPRQGRFELDRNGKIQSIRGHSVALQMLGVFLLWFGWYGFNPGSTLRLTSFGDQVAALAAINTSLSASFACISALAIVFVWRRTWDITAAMNGLLAGLVAITAPCAVVEPWAACVIGIIAGGVYLAASTLLVKLRIDDPVDAAPVHLANGTWGVLSVGVFAARRRIQEAYFPNSAAFRVENYGFIMGGGGRLLACQVVGSLAILVWVTVNSCAIIYALKFFHYLRVDRQAELEGVDKSEHAAVAWPEFDPNAVSNPLPPEVPLPAGPDDL